MEYKAPSIVKDYTLEWANDLPTGVTLSACTWTLQTGLTEDSSTEAGTTATIFISGGEAGKVYQVKASATGSDGQTYEQVFFITIQLNIN